ncbi:MAG TPA: tetratricopeptide repeat protein [Azospirillaceae bacterium]|nr:tetratricopeptide repeat protein [Azospirillaceae bacterium]
MASILEALEAALSYHRAGDLASATDLYGRILAVEPTQADALHLMGVALSQMGRPAEALPHLRGTLEVRPGNGRAHQDLALALRAVGDIAGALANFREAARLEPNAADVLNNLGSALSAAGDLDGAEAALERALALGYAEAARNLAALLSNRASALLLAGDPAAAEPLLTRARALDPHLPIIQCQQGMALAAMGRKAEAIPVFQAALALAPDHLDTLINLGDALNDQGRFDEAEAVLRRAAELAPGTMSALNNLGNALLGQGRLGQAVESYCASIAADPTVYQPRVNLGTALRDLGDDDAADEAYKAALRLRPGEPSIHWQRALARLAAGDFETGWEEYEWRWRGIVAVPEALARLPEWTGGDPAGKRILVHCEQGHGDTLQFCRYAALLARHGAHVGLTAQPLLVRLLRDSLPEVRIFSETEAVDPAAWDARVALMSLPHRFGTRLDTIPAETPYLRAPTGTVEGWRARLAALGPGLKVGLVWAGDPRRTVTAAHIVDRRRSLSLAALAPLRDVPGLTLLSLQKGEAAMQAQAPDRPFDLVDWTDELFDFADTAGLVSALDLVVTVDTAVAHLAGALRRPTCVLSRFDGCWRWLRDRKDSPWYPGLSLYRQSRWADWERPVAEMVADIRDLAARAA